MDESKKNSIELGQKAFLEKYKKKIFKDKVIKAVSIALIYLIGILLIGFISLMPLKVTNSSMEPLIKKNQYVMVNKLSYLTKDIKQGDIVCFKKDNNINIGRVISIGKSDIFIKDGFVYENDKLLKEEYLNEFMVTPDYYNLNYSLKSDDYFIIGDNRNAVYKEGLIDSRTATGTITRDDIIGKVLYK